MSKRILRVTAIEKFRRFIHGVSSYDTEQSVIDTICGEFKGNEYTKVGTAFHKAVEVGNASCCKRIDNGYEFDIEGQSVSLDYNQCQVALDYRNEHPYAFHEIRRYKDYGRAIVTGCADMIDGLEIRDIKTKYGTPRDADYINSCQWRFYLDIFGADVFHFDLFVFHGYDKEKHGYDVRGLGLTRHLPPITCYRYPEMESDNLTLLNEFMDWAESRGLGSVLPTMENEGVKPRKEIL